MANKESSPNEILAQKYMTVSAATEYIRSRYSDMEFSRKQLTRAVQDGNLAALRVGRLLYLRRKDVDEYALYLRPTTTQPEKLRYVKS